MNKIESIKSQDIRLKDGRTALLSTARLPDGKYETMVLAHDDEEIACQQTDTEAEALAFHRMYLDHYHVPELKGRYKKLADDLKTAVAFAKANCGTDDGGTCNFDAPMIHLEGWRKKLVEHAAATADCTCSFFSFFDCWIFTIPGVGQGNMRTTAAELARDKLKELGYSASVYYQMD